MGVVHLLRHPRRESVLTLRKALVSSTSIYLPRVSTLSEVGDLSYRNLCVAAMSKRR